MSGSSKVMGRKVVASTVPSLLKAVSRTAAKKAARTAASPAFLFADAAEFASEQVARGCGCDEDTSKGVAKGVGAGASVLIGAAVGGPVGAGVGLLAWGVGEAISCWID